MQTSGTSCCESPRCRRASRSSAEGENTEGVEWCLWSSIGGISMEGSGIMTSSGRAAHWQTVYESKGEREVSWFQESPSPSLELIALSGARAISPIIDVGGGASRLVDALLAAGYATSPCSIYPTRRSLHRGHGWMQQATR